MFEPNELSETVGRVYGTFYRNGDITLSADQIPYTEQFEILYSRVQPYFPATRHEVHRALINERKAGRLPGSRKGEL